MKIKSGCKVRKIAGESVIVNMGERNVNLTRIITLNPTSEWLWEQLQEGVEFDADKVAGLLTEEYDVDLTTASADAAKWIDQLREAGLVNEE